MFVGLFSLETAVSSTKDLEAIGYQVVRFWNNEVHTNIYGVMDSILNWLENVPPDEKPSSPALLPLKREKGACPVPQFTTFA